MGADIGMNSPEGLQFKDWLRAERLARGWSFPELASRLARLAKASGTEPDINVRTVETLIRRWESGRTSVSDKWLPMIRATLADAPATSAADNV
jgi:hypothetical protein